MVSRGAEHLLHGKQTSPSSEVQSTEAVGVVFQLRRDSDDLTIAESLSQGKEKGFFFCRGAHEQQISKVILREILNLSWNAKICISKNMALFLLFFRIGPWF